MRSTRALALLSAIAVLLFTAQSQGRAEPQGAAFSGVVVDKAEGVSIPYAHVWIHEETDKTDFTAQPDRAGRFSIRLPNGYYAVMVGAPGFAPFCKVIRIESDRPVTLKVSLGADVENLQWAKQPVY